MKIKISSSEVCTYGLIQYLLRLVTKMEIINACNFWKMWLCTISNISSRLFIQKEILEGRYCWDSRCLHKLFESIAIYGLGTGQILFLITRKLSITSVLKGLNKTMPSTPALLCLLAAIRGPCDTSGQWPCSCTASLPPHTWMWLCRLQLH